MATVVLLCCYAALRHAVLCCTLPAVPIIMPASLLPPSCDRSPDVGSGLPESPGAALAVAAAAALDDSSGEAGGTGSAFVVDSEVTGMLMMGALTPNCKKHSGERDLDGG